MSSGLILYLIAVAINGSVAGWLLFNQLKRDALNVDRRDGTITYLGIVAALAAVFVPYINAALAMVGCLIGVIMIGEKINQPIIRKRSR